jgi:hypothetical protein
MRRFRTSILCLCSLLVLALLWWGRARLGAQEPAPAFAPAFSAEQIDFTLTRQWRDATSVPVEQARVLKTLGLQEHKASWEELKWEGGTAAGGGTPTTFRYLLVLKAPVAVGAMCATPAEEGKKHSLNGGEVWYLKPGAVMPPNPEDPVQWVKVIFPPAQPLLRFAALPPNTKSQAFLYKDVRTGGASCLDYWHFYARRVWNMTPTGMGYAPGGEAATEADAVPRGAAWSSFDADSGRKQPLAVSKTNPATFILAWETEQTLAGIFLRSSATEVKWFAYTGDARTNPGIAPASAWQPLPIAGEEINTHQFTGWKCTYRWISLPAVKTRALKLQITACDGKQVWINGLGVFSDLGAAPAPTMTARDPRAPFRIAYTLPIDGEVAIALDDAQGRRLRNVQALTPGVRGAADFAWDLKDGAGQYVAPGTYRFNAIVGPPPALHYGLTAYPNIRNFWKDRVPWSTGHAGENGWLSDHCQNWVTVARGDRIYFGAPMAEAGECFIECDLDGKRLWGKHDFDPWTGVDNLAADGQAIYIQSGGRIFRMDPETRKVTKLCTYGRPERKGWLTSMTAWDGKIYIGFAGQALFDNAVSGGVLDLPNCQPKADDKLKNLLRLGGPIPGKENRPLAKTPRGNGLLYLESSQGPQDEQYNVIAFKQPIPLGSLVLPVPTAEEGALRISVLKPDAAYPPDPEVDEDWLPLPELGKPGVWTSVPAPPNTRTRALRLAFTRPSSVTAGKNWFARVEGMRILNRRFESLTAGATVRVNSGTVNARGEWDAQRTAPLGPEKPGVFLLEWAQPQRIDGLAIKEITGARTEIDVWDGPAGAPVTMDGQQHWKTVATYKQPRRVYDYSWKDNYAARYLDGYVEFKDPESGATTPFTTKAVRLRVVEPWYDHGDNEVWRLDGELGHGLHFSQEPIYTLLDTRKCGLLGVAPLRALGGEPLIDPLVYRRIEIFDGTTGALLKELPAQVGWGIACGPKGDLFAISADHTAIVKVDKETGATTPVIKDVRPSRMTVGPDGAFYLCVWDNSGPIRMYGADGKFIRVLGKPGGLQPGMWEPQRLAGVHNFCADKNGSLWLPEHEMIPRRILQYNTKSGELVKEILGNTYYGGGGTLNRYDKSRAYYGRMELGLDWATATSSMRGMLAKDVAAEDLVAIKRDGRLYLVTTPLKLNTTQERATVYLYDEATRTVRAVAAFGGAAGYAPLLTADVLALLPDGAVPTNYTFIWADRNGDEKLQAAEVQLEKKAEGARWTALGPFDGEMGCTSATGRYAVKEILPNGTPIYAKVPAPASLLKLANGNYFTMHSQYEGKGPSENFVVNAQNQKLWGYPASGGVSGLSIPNWTPGLVTNQFCIIGHEVDPGELGEFLVISTNTGQWNLWTADGLLAANVLLHKYDPRGKFLSQPTIAPGERVDPLTASQEHFHGFLTRCEADGKYYAIMGFNHITVLEVRGLEKFRRMKADVTVTAEDLQRARAWEANQAARTIAGRALLAPARQLDVAPEIDGERGPKEWGKTLTQLDDEGKVALSLGYDDTTLYLCWTARGYGALKNSGTAFQQYFKTGACLDFQIGADPAADPMRAKPVKGDSRLLITYVQGEPRVVLYQPVAPGAAPTERWRTFTTAAGETTFDRVVLVDNAEVAMHGDGDFTVEAAIPLATLGLSPKPGMRLKMDWGLLASPDGVQVKQRLYWANRLATGTSDEAVEARLEPRLWGYLAFE